MRVVQDNMNVGRFHFINPLKRHKRPQCLTQKQVTYQKLHVIKICIHYQNSSLTLTATFNRLKKRGFCKTFFMCVILFPDKPILMINFTTKAGASHVVLFKFDQDLTRSF